MEYSQIEIAPAVASLANFSLEPAALSEAVAFLAKRVVRRGETVPTLASILIDADPRGFVTMTANNTAQAAQIVIPAAVASPGVLCADAAALAAVAVKVKKDRDCHEIRFTECREGGAIIAARRGRFNVPTVSTDDFPLPPTVGKDGTLSAFTVGGAQFLADLAAMAPAMGKGEARAWLNGVAMQRREMAGRESLVMVATDGFAMALASRELPAGAETLADLILPRDAVEIIGHAGKLASPQGDVEFWSDGSRARVDMGDVTIWTSLSGETYPDWARPWSNELAPTGAQEALFPDLLPGAPLDRMERLGKVTKGIVWSPTHSGQIGEVPGDAGLLFGAMNLTDADACAKAGFSYNASGADGEIVGPDGVTYPVAFSDKAIHMSAAQVRALIGESCFETMEIRVPSPNGVHWTVFFILKWLWDDGASRFLTVRQDGRCWSGNDAWRREYLTRAQVEAALAGEVVEIGAVEAEPVENTPIPVVQEAPAPEHADICPLEAAQDESATDTRQDSQIDAVAALLARVEALEARLAAALPAESAEPAKNTENYSGNISSPPTEAVQARRSPAHERAVRRAWQERRARRDAAKWANHWYRENEAARSESAEALAYNANLIAKLESATQHQRFLSDQAETANAKRRRSTVLARDLQKRLAGEYRMVDRANERRREAEARALQAENALAAVKARARGWPPAVASVSVRFAA